MEYDLFTLESMLTLSGATGITLTIANGCQSAFNFNPRWLALIIAQIISLAGIYFSKGSASDYFVGFLNGFLIYCTAVGANQVSASTVASNSGSSDGDLGPMRSRKQNQRKSKRFFFSPWY